MSNVPFAPARAYLESLVEAVVRPAVREEVASAVADALRRAKLPEYMTRAEAAEYLGRSARTIDHLRSSGKLAFSKRGGRVLIKTADLDAFVEPSIVPARRAERR